MSILKQTKVEKMGNTILTKNRIQYLDMAKGFGILCIIAGHMSLEPVVNMVFIFHVPLFFLVSGYFISDKGTFSEFAKKRFNGLIVPYIFTSLCIIAINLIKDILQRNLSAIPKDFLKYFAQAVYGSGTDSNRTLFGITQIGAIWFLLALFWALIIVRFADRFRFGFCAVLALALIAYFSSIYVWLPFDIQAGCTAAVFVYIGKLARRHNLFEKCNPVLFALGIVFFVGQYIFRISLSVARNYFGLGPVSVIGAVLVSYSIIFCFKWLEKFDLIRKIFVWFGTNSLIILCFHLLDLKFLPWHYMYTLLDMIHIPGIAQFAIIFALKILYVSICTLIVLRIKWIAKIFGKVPE